MEKIFLIGVVCVILISIAVVDARKKKIPNILLGILFFCAVLSGFIFPEISWPDRIAGGILVSVVFLTVIWIRPGAFGAGDVKLMAISGLMLGVGRNLTAFGFATALAALYCLPGILRRDRKSRRLPLDHFCVWEFCFLSFWERHLSDGISVKSEEKIDDYCERSGRSCDRNNL